MTLSEKIIYLNDNCTPKEGVDQAEFLNVLTDLNVVMGTIIQAEEKIKKQSAYMTPPQWVETASDRWGVRVGRVKISLWEMPDGWAYKDSLTVPDWEPLRGINSTDTLETAQFYSILHFQGTIELLNNRVASIAILATEEFLKDPEESEIGSIPPPTYRYGAKW